MNDELYHFGVKGMKWGVRRDRKRSISTKRSKSDSDDYIESRKLLKKSPNKLSNSELRKLNERLNLEQQYKNLTTVQKQKGNRFIDRVGNQMKTTAVNAVSKQLLNIGKTAVVIALAYAASRMNNGEGYSPNISRPMIGR